MKSIFSIIALSFLFTVSIRAQYNYNVIPIMDYFRMEQMTEDKVTKTLTEADIAGSPYLSDEFSTGTIFTTDKYKIVNLPIRYNIYNDELEFKTPDNIILAITKPKRIELADFGTYQMSYRNYLVGSKERSGFFKILEEGKATLLARPEVFFQKAEPGDGIKPGKPAKFVTRPDLIFISLDKQPAVRINNKKDVYEALKTNRKELETYTKQNNLKITKADDLQQLIQYYNSL